MFSVRRTFRSCWSQTLEGKKLPENLRTKTVTFREMCEDALAHGKAENSAKQTYELRLPMNDLIEDSALVRPSPFARVTLSPG